MTDNEVLVEEKVAVSAKIAYGASNSANMYLSGIGLNIIDIFYLKATTISPAWLALSWILFIVWNQVNDPLIGILQDRTKTKIGRRIPYLRYGAPIYVLTFIWIWFPFTNVQEMLFFNHLLMLFLFDTLFSMEGLILYSMPAEMAITAKERGNIMLWTTAFAVIGILGSLIVPLIYLGEVPDLEGFRVMMIITGILCGIVFYIGSYFIKENEYTLDEEPLGFWESIKHSFKNKPFLIVEVSIFAMVLMQNVLVSYFIFIFDFVVDLQIDVLNVLLFILMIIVLGAVIIWINKNIEKYGLKWMMIIGGIIAIFGFTAFLFIGLSIDISPSNKMPLTLFLIPLGGIGLGLVSFLILNQPIMGECMDYDETLTGKRRETSYAGMNALITKPAVSIGHAIFLWIIAIYGYDETISDPLLQPAGISTGVILAFTVVPIICLIIGVIALFFYPLHGEEWRETKKNLYDIHVEKEKAYYEKLKNQADNSSNPKKDKN